VPPALHEARLVRAFSWPIDLLLIAEDDHFTRGKPIFLDQRRPAPVRAGRDGSAALEQQLHVSGKRRRPAAIAVVQPQTALRVVHVAAGGVVHGVTGGRLALDPLVVDLEVLGRGSQLLGRGDQRQEAGVEVGHVRLEHLGLVTLGVHRDEDALQLVAMLDGLMQGADRDLVKIWQKMNAKRFDHIMLKTKTVGAKATPEGIEVTFAPAEEGGTAPAPQTYDLVLQAVGRTPNGKKIAAEKAGVAVTERGFINVDIQMRTNVPHIFAIGDIVGQPMLAHKAVHEAHVAAEVIAGELQGNKELASAAFNARVIPSVAYTDPEVAWVGLTEDQAKAQGIKVKKGMFPWTASGRAIANGRDEGVTKLLFDDSPEAHGHGKILGGGMVGTHAGDMIGEVALAIEMGADAVDIGKTIHPHPTLGESIGMAAEVAHGSCTDVPPARK
jgi:pyruvate/2-oxoglutarate dehydrogenase complex dihydrolipoamide acyltransferase (E2) component